jgi:hypothetical protein
MEMQIDYRDYKFTLTPYKTTGVFVLCLKKEINNQFNPHEFAKFELIDNESLVDDEQLRKCMDEMIKNVEWAIGQVTVGKLLPPSWTSYKTD